MSPAEEMPHQCMVEEAERAASRSLFEPGPETANALLRLS